MDGIGLLMTPYEMADYIVDQLKKELAVASDDPSWQQAKATIATVLALNIIKR